MTKRLSRVMFGGVLLAAMMLPAVAFAADATPVAEAWQLGVGKAIAAGLAMGLAALGAGYAQAKIGSAGAGTLAERPEAATMVIVLQALPEVIVLLGFVIAFMIK
jgi:V/A-type H+/Na+-transporting ATPase subunit K